MTKDDLIKKFPVLDDELYNHLCKSILDLQANDDLGEERAWLVDLFTTWADDNGDDFYYDMTPCIQYIMEPDSVAYTTPDRIIALNYPSTSVVPADKNKYIRWYFIFCHECLHQLWDTFGVAQRIQDKGEAYNHTVLNLASDCVINDFLSHIDNYNKMLPIGVITPEVIKEKFDVTYDRNVDTQYTLYCKIMEKNAEKLNELLKDPDLQKYIDRDFDGKLTPKSVKTNNGPTPPPPPPINLPKDYIKGYSDAIQDVVDKKIDPLNDKYPDRDSDYNNGYCDALDNIKDGLENGVTLSSDNNQTGGGGQLPQIPWDIDNKNNNSNKSNGDPSDSQSGDNKSNNGGKGNNTNKSAKDVNDAINKYKDYVNNSPDVTPETKKKLNDIARRVHEEAKHNPNGDISDGLTKEISDIANEVADELRDAANKDGNPSNKNNDKINGDQSKPSGSISGLDSEGNPTKGKNDKGQDQQGSQKGNDANAQNQQGSNADAICNTLDNHENGFNGKQTNSKQAGHDVGDLYEREMISELSRHAESICNKYVSRMSGAIGEFNKKCKSSQKCERPDIKANSKSGRSSWAKQLEIVANTYVQQKLKTRKEFQSSYLRPRRGERAFTPSDFKNGRVINKGLIERKNKSGFDLGLYIDVSGSMGGCIKSVFSAIYGIVDNIISKVGHNPSVDASKINPKTYVFNKAIRQIEYGKSCNANGGTCSFDELVNMIHQNKEAFLNIVITDGEFDSINSNNLTKCMSECNGLFILVTSNAEGTFDEYVKSIKAATHQNKLVVIYTDANFTI